MNWARAAGSKRSRYSFDDKILQSPRLAWSLLVLTIFLTALTITYVLHRIPAIPAELDLVADMLLLCVCLYPCVVILVKRPYLRQVRERERAEATLSDTESRLNMILECNPYLMAVRDGNGIIHLASRTFADYYGSASRQMIGASLADLHHAAGMDDNVLEEVLAADRRVIDSWEPRFGMEKMSDRDGLERWYRYARLPVTMPSGERCVLSISGEITRRIRAEHAQKEANDELERRVLERTRELNASREQFRDLSARLRSALEEERTRISRELHDELGQSLTALKFDIVAAGNLVNPGQAPLAEKTKAMTHFVDDILAVVKKIARELRPGILDDLGLAAAIQWQGKEFRERTAIPCEVVVVPEDMILDPDRSTAIFRVFQETLTNIAKHSGATNVEAILECRDGTVYLEVRDNGRGITSGDLAGSESLGILGMRERIEWVGGEFRIEGSPGAGTIVRVTIPEGNRKAVHDEYSYCG